MVGSAVGVMLGAIVGAFADRIVRGEPFRSLMTTTVSTRRMRREEVDDILSGKRHDRVAPKSCSNLMLLARVGVHHRCEFRHLLRAFGCIDFSVEAFWLTRIGLFHLRAQAMRLREVGLSNLQHEDKTQTAVGRIDRRSCAAGRACAPCVRTTTVYMHVLNRGVRTPADGLSRPSDER